MDESQGVAKQPGPSDPVPEKKRGVYYRGGYFAKNLSEAEEQDFRLLYAAFKEAYPDLDAHADDLLLCEMIKKSIMLQRQAPPPSPQTGTKNTYDYEVARTKLVLAIADALDLNRKRRKDRETGADIEKALAKFFTQDGRSRDSSGGRTVTKKAAQVVVNEVEAARAGRENDDRWRESS